MVAPLRFALALVNGAALAAAAMQALALGESLAASARRGAAFWQLHDAISGVASGDAVAIVPAGFAIAGAAAQPITLAPGALLAYWPLSLFGVGAARSLWTMLQLAALALALGLLVHQSGLRWPRWLPAVFALLVLAFPPLRYALLAGHAAVLALALVACAWALGRRGRALPAGALLGLAIAIWPGLLVGVVPWLIWREWPGPAVAVGVAVAATAAALGVGAVAGAQPAVPDGWSAATWIAAADNASLLGAWVRLATPAVTGAPLIGAQVAAGVLALVIVAGALAALGWIAHVARLRRDHAWAGGVLVALLLGPLTEPPTLVLLLMPLVLLLRGLPLRVDPAWGLLLLGIALIVGSFVPGGARLADADGVFQPVVASLGLLVLLGLDALLAQRVTLPFVPRRVV